MSNTSNTKRSNGSQRSNNDWADELIWSIVKAIGHLLWLAILFPALSVPAFISLAMMLSYGLGAGMLTAIALGAGYGAWAALDAQSFENWIAKPVQHRVQTWWRYTRTWESVCTLNGLTARHKDRTLTPQLRCVWIGKYSDVIDLRVITGQSVHDWQKRARELAAAWRADRLTVRATAPGELRITITRYDYLAQPVRLPRQPANTNDNLSAVPVGITDTHQWWWVPVLGHHLLIAGATGQAKGPCCGPSSPVSPPPFKPGRYACASSTPKVGWNSAPGHRSSPRSLMTPPTPHWNYSGAWYG